MCLDRAVIYRVAGRWQNVSHITGRPKDKTDCHPSCLKHSHDKGLLTVSCPRGRGSGPKLSSRKHAPHARSRYFQTMATLTKSGRCLNLDTVFQLPGYDDFGEGGRSITYLTY